VHVGELSGFISCEDAGGMKGREGERMEERREGGGWKKGGREEGRGPRKGGGREGSGGRMERGWGEGGR